MLELKKQIDSLKNSNNSRVKSLETALDKSRSDKLRIQELYQANNRVI